MAGIERIRVAIVDYGLGNLFSVKHACAHVGMEGVITSAAGDILGADAVFLPGVGGFGNAMNALRRRDLVRPLQDYAASGKPLIGICLGLQLLMTVSYEFGTHKGLGLIDGPVVHLDKPRTPSGRMLKVPQVGWNRTFRPHGPNQPPEGEASLPAAWTGSPMEGVPEGAFMYFVHSYYVVPEDPGVTLTVAQYGNITFCSSLTYRNIFACQFHPERSGPLGLHIYRNIAARIREQRAAPVSKAER